MQTNFPLLSFLLS